MDEALKSVNETENLTVSPRSCTEAVNDEMATGDNSRFNIVFSNPRPKAEMTRIIFGLETTRVTNTRDVIEKMDETSDNIYKAEISEDVTGPYFDRINETGDLQATPESDEDSTWEIIHPIVDTSSMIEKSVATNAKEITEVMDQSAESCSTIGSLKTIFESCTGETTEIRKLTPSPSKDNMDEIVDHSDVSIDENLMDSIVPSTEEGDEIKDQTTEDISITENIEAIPVRIVGVINEIIDLETAFIPGASHSGEMMSEKADSINAIQNSERKQGQKEVIRDVVNLETVPGSNTEKTNKIMNEATNDTNISEENIKATYVRNSEEILLATTSSEIISNMTPGKRSNPIIIEIEKSDALIEETKRLKSACGRKRKRKAPPVSEMVMHSIKSQKMTNGASFQEIKKFMEEKYPVTVKALLKYHVDNYLQKWVGNGILEKIDGTDATRFKFKETKL